jgi:salicylate hydroxylase
MPEFSNVRHEGQELNEQQIVALGNALRENWAWWEDGADKEMDQALEILQAQGKFGSKL